uniref:Uncharacterized protein n=1 Tax=Glossina austeni TaxID=7395 RepID=A0A1A9V8G1_GLOAU
MNEKYIPVKRHGRKNNTLSCILNQNQTNCRGLCCYHKSSINVLCLVTSVTTAGFAVELIYFDQAKKTILQVHIEITSSEFSLVLLLSKKGSSFVLIIRCNI